MVVAAPATAAALDHEARKPSLQCASGAWGPLGPNVPEPSHQPCPVLPCSAYLLCLRKINNFVETTVLVSFSPQFSSVAHSCSTLCDPMNRSTPGLRVHHHLPEFTQTHVHRVGDAIQPSHPLSSPSPPAPNPSQHQSPFQ